MPRDRRMKSTSCAILLLGGCAGHPTYEPGVRMKWADDVGSVTISQSGGVTDWDDVASELQPAFKMDSEKAFNIAIPTTQSLDERLLDAFTANLQAGLPTSSGTTIASRVTDGNTGEIVELVDDKRTRQSGVAPAPGALTPTGAAALAALANQTLGDDPMLRYMAATALQQEVALLNRYIKDRVRWPGAQAFVARLQLTVLPNARSMPYDVETDITIHAQDEQSRARLANPLRTHDDGLAAADSANGNGAAEMIDARRARCAAGTFDTVQVLPMIVTDNLEGLRAARSTDNVRQLAAALAGTAGNVGLAGQFARTIEELRRSEGRDTNSLLTVAKLSDDTVRVKLGAVQSPRFGYVTSTRNHFISLVVIFRPCLSSDGSGYEDKGPRVLSAVTRTTFRDGATGQTLPYQNGSDRLQQQIKHIQSNFVGQFNYLELARMYQWASRQDDQQFFKYVIGQHLHANMCKPSLIKTIIGVSRLYRTGPADYAAILADGGYSGTEGSVDVPSEKVAGQTVSRDAQCLTLARMRYEMVAAPLWTELQSIRPTGQFAFTNIPIVLRTQESMLPPLQIALLNYTAGEASTTLAQGRNMGALDTVQMVLLGAPDGPIVATSTTISANGRAVLGVFPPLERFGIKAPDPTLPSAANIAGPAQPNLQPAVAPKYVLQIQVAKADPFCRRNRCMAEYPVRLFNAAATPAKSPYSIEASAGGIVSDPATGRGRLIVSIASGQTPLPSPDKLFLSIEGAQLASAHLRNGVELASEPQGWKVTATGDIVLEFENLIPNTVVKVNLRDGTSVAGSVSRSVVAASLRKMD